MMTESEKKGFFYMGFLIYITGCSLILDWGEQGIQWV